MNNEFSAVILICIKFVTVHVWSYNEYFLFILWILDASVIIVLYYNLIIALTTRKQTSQNMLSSSYTILTFLKKINDEVQLSDIV